MKDKEIIRQIQHSSICGDDNRDFMGGKTVAEGRRVRLFLFPVCSGVIPSSF